MKLTPQQIKDGLRNFYGTDGYTRYTFGILLTDGVRWLCENANCFWLVDAIASWQFDKRVREDEMLQGFQFWKLRVKTDDVGRKSAVLTLERDSNDVVLTQAIEFTDFPLDEMDLYYSPQDKVLLLPSEY